MTATGQIRKVLAENNASALSRKAALLDRIRMVATPASTNDHFSPKRTSTLRLFRSMQDQTVDDPRVATTPTDAFQEMSWGLGLARLHSKQDRDEAVRAQSSGARWPAATAGGCSYVAKGMSHFAWFTEETVLQLHGMGPQGITYVNPADDPRKK